jgi:hypothetical protein
LQTRRICKLQKEDIYERQSSWLYSNNANAASNDEEWQVSWAKADADDGIHQVLDQAGKIQHKSKLLARSTAAGGTNGYPRNECKAKSKHKAEIQCITFTDRVVFIMG